MMNKATAALDKARRKTNAILRANPGMSYRTAQQEAKKERMAKQSGRGKARTAGAVHKKKPASVGAKYRVRHVVEKIGAGQVNQTRQQLKSELEQQRAWMLLAKDSATSAAKRKKAAKDLAENKRELKAITGRKKKMPRKKRRR
jgi:hypothetical protein